MVHATTPHSLVSRYLNNRQDSIGFAFRGCVVRCGYKRDRSRSNKPNLSTPRVMERSKHERLRRGRTGHRPPVVEHTLQKCLADVSNPLMSALLTNIGYSWCPKRYKKNGIFVVIHCPFNFIKIAVNANVNRCLRDPEQQIE